MIKRKFKILSLLMAFTVIGGVTFQGCDKKIEITAESSDTKDEGKKDTKEADAADDIKNGAKEDDDEEFADAKTDSESEKKILGILEDNEGSSLEYAKKNIEDLGLTPEVTSSNGYTTVKGETDSVNGKDKIKYVKRIMIRDKDDSLRSVEEVISCYDKDTKSTFMEMKSAIKKELKEKYGTPEIKFKDDYKTYTWKDAKVSLFDKDTYFSLQTNFD